MGREEALARIGALLRRVKGECAAAERCWRAGMRSMRMRRSRSRRWLAGWRTHARTHTKAAARHRGRRMPALYHSHLVPLFPPPFFLYAPIHTSHNPTHHTIASHRIFRIAYTLHPHPNPPNPAPRTHTHTHTHFALTRTKCTHAYVCTVVYVYQCTSVLLYAPHTYLPACVPGWPRAGDGMAHNLSLSGPNSRVRLRRRLS